MTNLITAYIDGQSVSVDDELYMGDVGQSLQIKGINTQHLNIDFSAKGISKKSLATTDDNNNLIAAIPDELLSIKSDNSYTLTASFKYAVNGGTETLYSIPLQVNYKAQSGNNAKNTSTIIYKNIDLQSLLEEVLKHLPEPKVILTDEEKSRLKGVKGDDGFSPIISSISLPNGTKIRIEDKEGIKEFEIKNGEKGEKGENGERGKEGEKGEKGDPGIDGISPIISIKEIEGGYALKIQDKEGSKTVNLYHGKEGKQGEPGVQGIEGKEGRQGEPGTDGAPGKDGADGISPIIAIREIEGGHALDITDKEGSKSFNILDGKQGIQGNKGADGSPGRDGVNGQPGRDGTDGKDGISPTIAIDPISNGQKVTITDKNGSKSFNVLNGQKGDQGIQGIQGVQGPVGPQGKDYVMTDQDYNTIVNKVLSSMTNAMEVSL